MADHLTPYGFTFGPAEISRLTHIPGRGRTLEIRTDHACIQVYISEAGRKIEVHPTGETYTPSAPLLRELELAQARIVELESAVVA